MKDHTQMFAVVRVDTEAMLLRQKNLISEHSTYEEAAAVTFLDIGNYVTIKVVTHTKEEAEAEVERLNKLNPNMGSVYFCQITRLKPDNLSLKQRIHDARNVLQELTMKYELEQLEARQ